MSTVSSVIGAVADARKEWAWFLALGIATVCLGTASILYDVAATLASVVAFGAIISFAGILQLFAAFQTRGAGHVILYLLIGALDLVVGFVLIRAPAAGALSLTLVLSVYFMVGGILRAIYASWLQFPQYGWSVLSGVVSLALGIVLWMQWPFDSIWFIDFAVGMNLIFLGAGLSTFAMKLRPA